MPFIGNKPSAVPLTSADITDGIITSAKITDATIVNGDIANSTINLTQKVTGSLPIANGGTGLTALGTANQVLAVNSGATALEYQAVSSDYVLLATTDASNNATISFDGYFSSTYKNYKILISGLKPATDNTAFRIRFRSNNADVTSSNYVFSVVNSYIQSNTSSGSGGSGTYNANAITLFDNADSGNDEQSVLELTFFDPLSTNSFKNMMCFSVSSNNDATQWQNNYLFSRLRVNSSTALSGFTFYFSSGNVSTGNFKLYGIK